VLTLRAAIELRDEALGRLEAPGALQAATQIGRADGFEAYQDRRPALIDLHWTGCAPKHEGGWMTKFDPGAFNFVRLGDFAFPGGVQVWEHANHTLVDGRADFLRINAYLSEDKDFVRRKNAIRLHLSQMPLSFCRNYPLAGARLMSALARVR
jgi:hypothetical protein